MYYVEQTLNADEKVLMLGRFPWPYHAVAWGALVLLGVFGIGVLIWIMMLVHFKTTESAITTHRVVYKRGLFTRRTMELGLTAVEQVELLQGFWGRVFGFGVVAVSGTGDSTIRSHPIAHPVLFRRMVNQAKARANIVRIAPDGDDLALAPAPAAPPRPAFSSPRAVPSAAP